MQVSRTTSPISTFHLRYWGEFWTDYEPLYSFIVGRNSWKILRVTASTSHCGDRLLILSPIFCLFASNTVLNFACNFQDMRIDTRRYLQNFMLNNWLGERSMTRDKTLPSECFVTHHYIQCLQSLNDLQETRKQSHYDLTTKTLKRYLLQRSLRRLISSAGFGVQPSVSTIPS